MRLRPISLREARRFIAEKHRHNDPMVGWKAGVGVEVDGQLVGVGVLAHYPQARMLADGWTTEITRTCTDGTENVCSMIYGSLCRAAEGLGYDRVVTYTLEEEDAASVRAAGFVFDGWVEAQDWGRPGRPRHQHDLFGNDRRPPGRKKRWRRDLRSQARKAAS